MKEQIAVRKFLAIELENIQKKNPRYSLRSYADKIGISPAALSLILSGKRKVSKKLVGTICDNLKVEPVVRSELLKGFFDRDLMVTEDSVDSPDPAHRPHKVTPDILSQIRDWHYFALLSLLKTKDFQDDPRWVAERLGITEETARYARQKLLELGLVRTCPKKGLIRTHQQITTVDDKENPSIQYSQKQILNLAFESIGKVSVEQRDMTTLTVATNPDKLDEAKALIRQFQAQLDTLLFSATEKTEVYALSVALFPLSQIKKASHE